ncbi:hypothetical protein HAX54_033996 [Datura stramonium]|uniref:Bushy growth protein n=1 Tax=Datura stramonium TaxID=4076 RepID=A0ABS8VDY8_DATST|nr:hypothetical protein [Datura stramonium]
MYTGERVVPIKLDLRVNHTVIKDHFFWDLNNFESDPEEFARTFCKDMGIEDPEVGSVYQPETTVAPKISHVFSRFGVQIPWKRRDWDVYEPIVDLLSNEEVDALEAREERVLGDTDNVPLEWVLSSLKKKLF